MRLVLVPDLPHDLLDEVLEGRQPRRAAEFIEHDRHLGTLVLEFRNELLHGSGDGGEDRRAGQIADLGHPLLVGPPQVARHQHAHDSVEGSGVHRQPQVAVVEHDLLGLFHGGARIDRHDVGARGHDLSHRDLVQAHDVGHHLPLVLRQGSGGPRHPRHHFDFLAADVRAVPRSLHQPLHPREGHEQRRHGECQRLEDVGGRRGELLAEAGSGGLGNDLGEDQDGEGEDGREAGHPGAAEEFVGQRPRERGARGVGHGVEREDGRDRLVDAALQLMQKAAGASSLRAPHLDEARVDGEENRLQNRTEPRDGERGDQGHDEDRHRTDDRILRGQVQTPRRSRAPPSI